MLVAYGWLLNVCLQLKKEVGLDWRNQPVLNPRASNIVPFLKPNGISWAQLNKTQVTMRVIVQNSKTINTGLLSVSTRFWNFVELMSLLNCKYLLTNQMCPHNPVTEKHRNKSNQQGYWVQLLFNYTSKTPNLRNTGSLGIGGAMRSSLRNKACEFFMYKIFIKYLHEKNNTKPLCKSLW